MASHQVSLINNDLTEHLLVELISGYFKELPKLVIKAGVKLVLSTLDSITLDSVRSVLRYLGVPDSWAGQIWGDLVESTNEDDGVDEDCECECPESGDTITLSNGDGEYRCPDCKQDILVSGGYAWHAILVECPVVEEEFWAGPEDGDESECPHCSCQVVVNGNSAKHTKPLKVRCPETGDRNPVGNTDGPYTCTDCGESIDVEDGVATHN